MGGYGLDSSDLEYGPLMGACKHSEDPFGFIRSGARFTLNLINTTVLVSHIIG
jgi:hypothetical protein